MSRFPILLAKVSGKFGVRGKRFVSGRGLSILFAAASLLGVHAHKPSDSYLSFAIRDGIVSGQWDIALRDLENAVGLDENGDGAITWGELTAREETIVAYAFARLHLRLDADRGEIRMERLMVEDHVDGAYAVLQFTVDGGRATEFLEIDYGLLFDLDPTHRCLVRIVGESQTLIGILSPDSPVQQFELRALRSGRGFMAFLSSGVWHIWIGFDHILFLVALLLPSVLRREGGRWIAEPNFRLAFAKVIRTVTAFTVAHSLTLGMAAYGLVHLSSRLVESTIAASVAAAALNNIVPVVQKREWAVAFVFGLIHGFGFATVLDDLGLEKATLAFCLAAFNLGVEIGQLAIVCCLVPLAFGLRGFRIYRRFGFQFGSALIAIVAAAWMSERVFQIRFLPF